MFISLYVFVLFILQTESFPRPILVLDQMKNILWAYRSTIEKQILRKLVAFIGDCRLVIDHKLLSVLCVTKLG